MKSTVVVASAAAAAAVVVADDDDDDAECRKLWLHGRQPRHTSLPQSAAIATAALCTPSCHFTNIQQLNTHTVLCVLQCCDCIVCLCITVFTRYLRQGAYVLHGVCLSFCLSVSNFSLKLLVAS